jgi:hypothetical protein
MIWAEEAASLRQNPNDDVEWYIDNQYVATFSGKSILDALTNRLGTLHSYKDTYWISIDYSKLTTISQSEFPFIDAYLKLASKNDKIVTINTSDLGLIAPKGSTYNLTFELEDGLHVVVPFTSNRSSQATLSAPMNSIPRGIKLPKVGSPVKVKVKV